MNGAQQPPLAIELRGLTKLYGKVQALRGVSLTVQRGEIFGFLGPNGAGKTTTIRILTAFIRRNGGEASVLGLDPWTSPVEVKARTGFLPDQPEVYPGMSGRDFLDYFGRLRGTKSPALQKVMLDRLELAETTLLRKVKGYSRGMLKKLVLVCAMQHDPELLIMDEPTDGLDPLMRRVLFGLLHEYRDRGGTVFMSSHVLADVEDLCERVALIRHGEIVHVGSVDALRAGRSRTMVVQFRQPPDGAFDVPGVDVVERDGTTWRLAVRGDVNPVLRALAQCDVEELVYERLGLDELFMGFYGEAS